MGSTQFDAWASGFPVVAQAAHEGGMLEFRRTGGGDYLHRCPVCSRWLSHKADELTLTFPRNRLTLKEMLKCNDGRCGVRYTISEGRVTLSDLIRADLNSHPKPKRRSARKHTGT